MLVVVVTLPLFDDPLLAKSALELFVPAVARALPDARDGLKPVHRRVLYAMFDGGYRPDAEFDGITPGTTTVDIIQPTGHTTPANGYTTRTVNVSAPDVWVLGGYDIGTSIRYRDPFEIGVDLQISGRVTFETMPPVPIDVVVSAPPGSGRRRCRSGRAP